VYVSFCEESPTVPVVACVALACVAVVWPSFSSLFFQQSLVEATTLRIATVLVPLREYHMNRIYQSRTI